jgi:hypothetical protein
VFRLVLLWVSLNFNLDKSMPTTTAQHNTMSALVDKPKENARRGSLKPRGRVHLFYLVGEEEMSECL